MSFNSDGSPPSTSSPAAGAATSRDWIFPSYSFVHSTHSIRRTPRRRRFSSYHPPPPQFNSSAAAAAEFSPGEESSSLSSAYQRSRPRSFELGKYEKSTRLQGDDGPDGPAAEGVKSDDVVFKENDEVKDSQTTPSEKTLLRFLKGRLRIRPQLAFTVSVSSSPLLCVCVCSNVQLQMQRALPFLAIFLR